MIGEAADPHDLLAARLSCTEIRGGVTKPFVKAYFTIRKHIVTEYSLLALIDITAHPVFGPAIREIWINVFTVATGLFDYLEEHYGVLEADEYMDLVKGYAHITREENKLDEGYDTALLAQALSNLKKLNVVVSLGVFNDKKSEKSSWGYQHACDLFPEETFYVASTDSRLKLIFEAAFQAQYPVRGLLVASEMEYELVAVEPLNVVISQITEAHIHDEQTSVSECKASLIFKFLGDLPRLTKLRIEASDSYRDTKLFQGRLSGNSLFTY